MNHGRCKNCWWWGRHPSLAIPQTRGICYMQSRNTDCPGAEVFHESGENEYCPDYINRKRVKEKPIWQQ